MRRLYAVLTFLLLLSRYAGADAGRSQASCQPIRKGAYDSPGTALAVAVDGSTAFLADGEDVRIIDVSNPLAPALRSAVDYYPNIVGVAVRAPYLYVLMCADGYGLRFATLDVSDPAAPVETAYTGFNNGVGCVSDGSSLTVAGGLAYVTGGNNGWGGTFVILDVSVPTAVTVRGSTDYATAPVGVAVSGSYAYVADGANGLRVIDVTDSNAPVGVATLDTPDFASAVAVSGSRAYVADGGDGLRVIDITNPAHPTFLTALDTPDSARGVVVAGAVAYVADLYSVQVVDITNPSNPMIAGSVSTPGAAAKRLALSGSLLAVADGAKGAEFFDVSSCTGAGSAPTANFTYSPANPAPGQAVAFTNTSIGSPTSYTWTFGDGGTSTAATPSHTFAAPGTYSVTLTATNSSGSNAVTKSVVVSAGGCTSAPSTSTLVYPSSGATGVPISNATFSWTAANCVTTYDLSLISGSSCTGSPLTTYSGLTTTSYTVGSLPAASTLSWKITAKNSYGSTSSSCASFTTAGGGGTTTSTWFPGTANAAGAGGSYFRTSLVLVNRSTTTATVSLKFRKRNETSPTAVGPFSIPAGGQKSWTDVVGQAVGLSSVAGSIEVVSDQALVGVSRTYNQGASGTYGQNVDGFVLADGLSAGQSARLPWVEEDTAFRTNVGFLNMGETEATLRFEAYATDGTKVGSNTYVIQPKAEVFTAKIMASLGILPFSGYGMVVVTSGSGVVSYGSLVDNATSDPTTVTMRK